MNRSDLPPPQPKTTTIQPRRARASGAAGGTRVTFLGHASTVLEMDGVRLVTDPVLRRLVGPLYRRVPQPLMGPLVDPDAILISHLHLDHYDPRSLRMFRRDTPVVAPVGAGLSLRWRGFREIYEIEPGERLRLGAVDVVGAEAQHRGTRHPLAARTPSLGYVVSGSKSLYFAGDTGFFSGIADVWPERLDLALLPIAGIGPMMPEFKHMSPRDAVRAMDLLRPRLVVPIHWGTYHLPGTALFRFGPDFHRRAPYLFMAQASALEPDVHTVMLRPGEALSVEETLARHEGHTALAVPPSAREPSGPPELAGPGVPGGIY
jgi:L-ascorbate metabolism protein UlaG (beta-lactamase superfamily)